MNGTMSRRNFLRLSATTIGGAMLAACVSPTQQAAPASSSSAPGSAPVEIRLAEGSWVGPEGIDFWTKDIIGAFEAENPNIKVTYESAESPDYEDKLFTQAVAGDAPDVFFIWWSYGLMEQGQLLALDDHFDQEYMSKFYQGNIVGQQYEGKLYGIPKYVSTVAMAYNKDILDAAGIPYPDATWTWDNYLEAYRATTDAEKGQWGTYVAHQYLPHYVWMNGGQWMNADLFGTQCLLNEAKAMEALKFEHDLIYGEQPVAPQPGGIADFGWDNVFSSGKIAFMESHSWTVTNYMRQNNFKWDLIDLPVARDGGKAGLTFTNGYSIYNGTKQADAAVTLVKFLTSPERAKQMCLSILGLQPARRDATDVWDKETEAAKAGYDVAAFTRIMDHARLDPAFKDGKQILTEIFNPIWDQIWVTNEMGLEEGINTLVQRIDEHFKA
ncbi:MAG: extracellular solute-binding protein [Caldilineaceae bacterium]